MQFHQADLHTCHGYGGTVVAIDVLRAFTTAAYALAAGAERILLAGEIEEAFALQRRFPGARLMGELYGDPIPGFDYSNSPLGLDTQDIPGRTLIQRTTAGTQGVVRSSKAEELLAASFVVASATARYLRQRSPESVTWVITGRRPLDASLHVPEGLGDEDAACAAYLQALLEGRNPSPESYLERARLSPSGRRFSDPVETRLPAGDLAAALKVDRFPFAMHIDRQDGLFILRAIYPEPKDGQ